MKKYKKTLKIRRALLSLLAAAAIGLGIYNIFLAPEEVKSNVIFEFQYGFTAGLGALAIALMIQYTKALRSETALQLQYNKENDERMKTIRAKAGLPMSLISSVIMIAAGVVIGYVNTVVFYTLIAAAMCQIIAACIIKLICMRTM